MRLSLWPAAAAAAAAAVVAAGEDVAVEELGLAGARYACACCDCESDREMLVV